MLLYLLSNEPDLRVVSIKYEGCPYTFHTAFIRASDDVANAKPDQIVRFI